jgi:hypothetical protein
MHKRAVAAVVLLAAVVMVAVGILVSQQDPVQPQVDTPPDVPTHTLIVQVRDSSLLSRASVLLGVTDGERLNQMWWPADWWVDMSGRQEIIAADLGRLPVPYVMQTVQNQVQVRVDDAWVMDRLAFAGVVDAVGGVRLDIGEAVVFRDEAGSRVTLSAGVQPLTGDRAADYVLDPGLRDEGERVRRFRAVWDQVLRRLPTDPERARTLVVSLGALSKPTLPPEQLAALLAEARELRVTGRVAEGRVRLDADNTVRVRPRQGVGTAYAVDADATEPVVDRIFDGYPAGEDPVARVLAAVPRAPAVEAVRGGLLSRGWPTAWGGRAAADDPEVVIDPGVPPAGALTVEQALGMEPVRAPVALGDARVVVADDDALELE